MRWRVQKGAQLGWCEKQNVCVDITGLPNWNMLLREYAMAKLLRGRQLCCVLRQENSPFLGMHTMSEGDEIRKMVHKKAIYKI